MIFAFVTNRFTSRGRRTTGTASDCDSRFGANFEISEELTVGFRARSGNGDDPNSPHHTFSNAFDSINFNLDRAFAKYNPYWAPSLTVYGGKFGKPDGHESGLRRTRLGRGHQPRRDSPLFGKARMLALLSAGMLSTSGTIAQRLSTRTRRWSPRKSAVAEKSTATRAISGALGYYYYSNLTPNDTPVSLANNNFERRGNLMVGAPELYASDFEILDAYMAYDTTIRCVPVVISGEYIKNDAAINDDDEGWAVGVAAGSTSEPGGRQFFYQYQDIEQEAVFAGFVNDDFPYATNYHGHVIGMNQKLGKATVVRIWALNSERSNAGRQSHQPLSRQLPMDLPSRYEHQVLRTRDASISKNDERRSTEQISVERRFFRDQERFAEQFQQLAERDL